MNGMPCRTTGELPGFLVIGAMRSGTSALYSLLSQHPAIRPSRIKETYFFVNDRSGKGTWDKGEEWYKSLFPEEEGLRGEASTLYSMLPRHPGVAERIYLLIPNVKLIYLVRHPVDRAVSHYVHSVLKGLENRSIHEALVPDPRSSYVAVGLYHMQLSAYLTKFKRNQFHIVTSEVLWRNLQETVNGVFDFLSVPKYELDLSKKILKNPIGHTARKIQNLSNELINDGQRNMLSIINAMPSRDKEDSASIAHQLGFMDRERAALAECFQEDIANLENLMGRRLTEWNR